MERVVSGMVEVIPDTARRVAPKSMNHRKMPLVILGIPTGAAVLAFNEPAFMFVLVPLWLWGSWRLGQCPHCNSSDDEQAEETDEHTEEPDGAV